MLINSNIKLLVVHCSDTENGNIIDATHIHKMHLDFGWDGIGYHKIILRSGKIESSLGVCLIGRDKFTTKQFISLERVLQRWKKLYPKAKIVGHYNTGNTTKTCPNFDVITWSKTKNL